VGKQISIKIDEYLAEGKIKKLEKVSKLKNDFLIIFFDDKTVFIHLDKRKRRR